MRGTRRLLAILLFPTATLLWSAPAAALADKRDVNALMQAINDLMQFAAPGRSLDWRNPGTGNKGRVTVLRQADEGGRSCWAYERTYQEGDRNLAIEGTSCEIVPGLWEIVAEGEATLRYDRSQVRETQFLLTERGYSPGPIDGALGPKTGRAIGDYQRDQGLPVTGEPSASLLAHLRSEANEPSSDEAGVTPPQTDEADQAAAEVSPELKRRLFDLWLVAGGPLDVRVPEASQTASQDYRVFTDRFELDPEGRLVVRYSDCGNQPATCEAVENWATGKVTIPLAQLDLDRLQTEATDPASPGLDRLRLTCRNDAPCIETALSTSRGARSSEAHKDWRLACNTCDRAITIIRQLAGGEAAAQSQADAGAETTQADDTGPHDPHQDDASGPSTEDATAFDPDTQRLIDEMQAWQRASQIAESLTESAKGLTYSLKIDDEPTNLRIEEISADSPYSLTIKHIGCRPAAAQDGEPCDLEVETTILHEGLKADQPEMVRSDTTNGLLMACEGNDYCVSTHRRSIASNTLYVPNRTSFWLLPCPADCEAFQASLKTIFAGTTGDATHAASDSAARDQPSGSADSEPPQSAAEAVMTELELADHLVERLTRLSAGQNIRLKNKKGEVFTTVIESFNHVAARILNVVYASCENARPDCIAGEVAITLFALDSAKTRMFFPQDGMNAGIWFAEVACGDAPCVNVAQTTRTGTRLSSMATDWDLTCRSQAACDAISDDLDRLIALAKGEMPPNQADYYPTEEEILLDDLRQAIVGMHSRIKNAGTSYAIIPDDIEGNAAGDLSLYYVDCGLDAFYCPRDSAGQTPAHWAAGTMTISLSRLDPDRLKLDRFQGDETSEADAEFVDTGWLTVACRDDARCISGDLTLSNGNKIPVKTSSWTIGCLDCSIAQESFRGLVALAKPGGGQSGADDLPPLIPMPGPPVDYPAIARLAGEVHLHAANAAALLSVDGGTALRLMRTDRVSMADSARLLVQRRVCLALLAPHFDQSNECRQDNLFRAYGLDIDLAALEARSVSVVAANQSAGERGYWVTAACEAGAACARLAKDADLRVLPGSFSETAESPQIRIPCKSASDCEGIAEDLRLMIALANGEA